jgi:hypothetical protein
MLRLRLSLFDLFICCCFGCLLLLTGSNVNAFQQQQLQLQQRHQQHVSQTTPKKHNNNNNIISTTTTRLISSEATEIPYGEESRQFRRTVYSHDDWVKHRSPDRFWNNLKTTTKSGIYKVCYECKCECVKHEICGM